MPLPATGPLALSQVNTELGRPATQALNMNDGALRQLAGVPSGTIAMSHLRGKSSSSTLVAGQIALATFTSYVGYARVQQGNAGTMEPLSGVPVQPTTFADDRSNSSNGNCVIIFPGDVTAWLAGKTPYVNGVAKPMLAPTYNSTNNSTYWRSTRDGNNFVFGFVNGGTYEVAIR